MLSIYFDTIEIENQYSSHKMNIKYRLYEFTCGFGHPVDLIHMFRK